MRRLQVLAALLVWFVLGAAGAFGQTVSATTGAINGRVTDATGGVLPGVTVTIASPSMQGTKTDVTNAEGSYRFPAVPPGDYKITYELPGFAIVVRDGIRVGLGFTATVTVEMKVASLAETVTVSGESPVVDTQSTKTSTNFTAKELASLPTARDFWSILAAAPGVQLQRIDVGGSAAGTQTNYSVYDTKYAGNMPMVEGMVMTEGTTAAMFYYDYGSMDEVAIGTAGHSAEMPWPGVQSQFIAKSGGNSYHGTAYADYENERLQSRNIDAGQTTRGLKGGGGLDPTDLNRMHKYRDVDADIGGYLKKDKLWWYFSARDQDILVRYPNFPVKTFETHLSNLSGKATYTLSENNKFVAYTQWGRKRQPNRLDRYLIPATTAVYDSADSTWNQQYWGYVWKGEWSHVINNRMYFDIHGGSVGYHWPNHSYTDAPSYEDRGNNRVYGSNREWAQDIARPQVLGSFSIYKDKWAGTHNFKVGGSIFRETLNPIRGLGGKLFLPNNVLHVLNNGQPIEVYLFESPSISRNGLWTDSAYANDTWQVNGRLTFTLGLRFDRYRSFLPEQTGPTGRFDSTPQKFAAVNNLLTWNLFAPRVGATFDVSGNGKTVVKLNYGQYWWNPGTNIAQDVNPNPPEWYRQYRWTDLNRNGVWDPGEEGQLIASRGGGASVALDPNLKNQYTREISARFEHEVAASFGVSTGFIYRRIGNLYQRNNANRPSAAFTVPVLIPDPGPDGRAGTADDGPAIQGFGLSPAYLGLPTLNRTENVPGRSEFYTWEISANRRFSGGWSLLAAFSYRWNRDNDSSYFGNNLRSLQVPANPNETINTSGGRYNFTIWALKLHGTYEGPWGLRITPELRHQAGQPFGRTFVATLNYGSQRILAEPISTRRMDNITIVDARVEKVFHLGQRTLSAFLDVFNIANVNPAQIILWNSGTAFLQPTSIVPPRIARLGLRVDW